MIGYRFPQPISVEETVEDGSAFSGHCCGFLNCLEKITGEECHELLESFEAALGKTIRSKSRGIKFHSADALILAIGGDPLAIGWASEFLSAQRSPSGDASLARTQFFTPGWIAQYLCQEAIGDRTSFALLDPACGAGHLLVRALQTACDGGSGPELLTKVRGLLGHSLFGLEVDAGLVELGAFSLYLKTRDILRERHAQDWLAELPLPRIICLEKPLGSLKLAQSALPPDWPGAFDAVVMNPPYLSTRTMDDTTADYLKTHYPTTSGDLYTAFMQLAISLLKPGGRLSTIVQQSFLSITRYRAFRLGLLTKNRLLSCVQLGTGAFPSRPGEKVNNALITLERSTAADNDEINVLRMGGRHGHTAAIESGLGSLVKNIVPYRTARDLIDCIPGQPFAFHCHPEAAALFMAHPSLADLGDDFILTNGLFTCDNERFVKRAGDLAADERGYVPYDKGGGRKWYHETPYRLRWQDDGEEIRAFRASRGQSRSLPGESQYFQPGITYSYIGTSGFCARLLSPDSIFDIASSAIFSTEYDLHFLLGWLNSALVAYLLSVLNPTVNFQIGDLRKLPFKSPSQELALKLAKLAGEAVSIARDLERGRADESMIEREQGIQAQIDALIFQHYELSNEAQAAVMREPWVQKGLRPLRTK